MAVRVRAVLRAGLARGARRHQAAALGIAAAAALVFQGPQLPAERAARQGDRGLHRGGQGRPGDGRAALRAGEPVPPPRRDRARDPHAPEPAGTSGSGRGAAAARHGRAGAGLSQGRASRSCGRDVSQAQGLAASRRGAEIPARDLSAGKGLDEGRRDRARAGKGLRAVRAKRNRELLLRARAVGSDAFAPGSSWATSRPPRAITSAPSRPGSASSSRTRVISRSSRSACSRAIARSGAPGRG